MLYTLKDIVSRLGVNQRDVVDVAHRKYISLVKDTSGAGNPRIYNFQSIYELCICLALRGRIPKKIHTASLIRDIINLKSDIVFITYTSDKKYIVSADTLPRVRSIDPQSFCFDIIETGKLRKHLIDIFGWQGEHDTVQ